jgi:hypothetical protein
VAADRRAGLSLFPSNSFADRPDFVAPADGVYTLILEGQPLNGGEARFAFNVQRVDDMTVPLALNAPVRDSIATAGEINRYSFTLNQPTRVVFDSLTDSGSLFWSLSGPGGTAVAGRQFSKSDGTVLGGEPAIPLARAPGRSRSRAWATSRASLTPSSC